MTINDFTLRVWKHCETYSYRKPEVALRGLLVAALLCFYGTLLGAYRMILLLQLNESHRIAGKPLSKPLKCHNPSV